MRFILIILFSASRAICMNDVEGVTAGKFNCAFEKASRRFIEKGNYLKSNDFSEENRDVFVWVQKIVDGNIKMKERESDKISSATWLIGDRITNLLKNNKFKDASQLIKNLSFVDKGKADRYEKSLRVYSRFDLKNNQSNFPIPK